MATSTNTARGASIRVEMHARGVDCDPHAQDASYAAAQWLDAQDTTTLASDYAEYVAAEIAGDAAPTDGSRRFVALLDAAHVIADDAATAGWATPNGADITVSITPLLSGASHD